MQTTHEKADHRATARAIVSLAAGVFLFLAVASAVRAAGAQAPSAERTALAVAILGGASLGWLLGLSTERDRRWLVICTVLVGFPLALLLVFQDIPVPRAFVVLLFLPNVGMQFASSIRSPRQFAASGADQAGQETEGQGQAP